MSDMTMDGAWALGGHCPVVYAYESVRRVAAEEVDDVLGNHLAAGRKWRTRAGF